MVEKLALKDKQSEKNKSIADRILGELRAAGNVHIAGEVRQDRGYGAYYSTVFVAPSERPITDVAGLNLFRTTLVPDIKRSVEDVQTIIYPNGDMKLGKLFFVEQVGKKETTTHGRTIILDTKGSIVSTEPIDSKTDEEPLKREVDILIYPNSTIAKKAFEYEHERIFGPKVGSRAEITDRYLHETTKFELTREQIKLPNLK